MREKTRPGDEQGQGKNMDGSVFAKENLTGPRVGFGASATHLARLRAPDTSRYSSPQELITR